MSPHHVFAMGVPLCRGGAYRTRADMLGPDGNIPRTRHYASLY